jgi:hypothetical protein
MSTLLELNETLKQQGDKLGNIDKGISTLVKNMSGSSLQDLEAKRDAKEGRGVLGRIMGGGKTKSKGSSGGNGLLSNFGFGLGGFGLGALGIGGILKAFGGIGAVTAGISLLMTPENVKKAEELFNNLSDIKDSVGKYFENIDISLPSMSDIGNKITGIAGSLLDTINNMLTLDFDGLQNTLATDADNLAVAAATAKRMAGKNVLPRPPKGVPSPQPEMTKGERQKINSMTGKSLSKKKIQALEKQGYKVNKDGALTKGGKAISVDETDKAFKKAGIKTSTSAGSIFKKYPRVMKLLKVPGIGTALSVGSILSTLADESLSRKEKMEQIAGSLGGIGGGLLGAAAGATIGTAVLPAFGTLIGGLLGGAGGALFGEELAGAIAKWALGGDNDGLKELNDLSKQIDSNSVAGQSANADDPFAMSMPTPAPRKGFTPAVEGQALRALQQESSVLQQAASNVTVVAPTTTNVTNGSSSVSFGGGISVTDSLDQGTR